ncbi:TPA: integrase [Pseudomonas aeruginosa]
MATVAPPPVVRKTDWPTNEKTFRTERDAEDWARRTEDKMVRGVYIQHCGPERM